MNNEHSKLPPSSAARRMACPGSRALEEQYARKEESDASEEGKLAHEAAAGYLRNEALVNIDKYTDEMREGAKLYKSIIKQYLFNDDLQIRIEEPVDIYNIHPECWGTPDAFGRDKNVLHVFDYKYGFTPIEAFENWQLIEYACGIGYDLSHAVNITDIYLHIVQPRDYISSSKHKVWHLIANELSTYRQRLIVSEALAMSPNAPLRVSNECKHCPARHACPALKQAAFGATEIAFREVPQGLNPAHVGSELKLLQEARDLLEFRITALETEVQHLLQSGVAVDNYELMPITGRLDWNVDKKQVLEFGNIMGVNLQKEDVLTPTQAIKAGINEELVLKYSERKQSLKLSRIDLNKSKKIFGKDNIK